MTRGARARRPATQTAKHPGRALFRSLTRKRTPLDLEQSTDLDLLRVVLPGPAAESLLSRCGDLSRYSTLGAAGPRALLDLPGVDEATAAKVLALFELAVRIG